MPRPKIHLHYIELGALHRSRTIRQFWLQDGNHRSNPASRATAVNRPNARRYTQRESIVLPLQRQRGCNTAAINTAPPAEPVALRPESQRMPEVTVTAGGDNALSARLRQRQRRRRNRNNQPPEGPQEQLVQQDQANPADPADLEQQQNQSLTLDDANVNANDIVNDNDNDNDVLHGYNAVTHPKKVEIQTVKDTESKVKANESPESVETKKDNETQGEFEETEKVTKACATNIGNEKEEKKEEKEKEKEKKKKKGEKHASKMKVKKATKVEKLETN